MQGRGRLIRNGTGVEGTHAIATGVLASGPGGLGTAPFYEGHLMEHQRLVHAAAAAAAAG